MNGYLLLPMIDADSFNTNSTPFTQGISMTMLAGYVHTIERHLHEMGLSHLRLKGFVPLFHQTFQDQVNSSTASFIQQPMMHNKKKDQLDKHFKGTDIHTSMRMRHSRGHLTMSLLISVEGEAVKQNNPFAQPEHKGFDPERLPELMKRVRTQRLSSSAVRMDEGEWFPVNASGRLIERLLALPRAVMPVERADLIQQYLPLYKDDRCRALLHALEVHVSRDREYSCYSRAQSGWIAALPIGFMAREKPVERENAYAHVYGENVITLAEYTNAKRVLQALKVNNQSVRSLPFWDYRVEPEKGLYLVQPVKQ
jgi:CRISPR type I-F-associated protein Csy2